MLIMVCTDEAVNVHWEYFSGKIFVMMMKFGLNEMIGLWLHV